MVGRLYFLLGWPKSHLFQFDFAILILLTVTATPLRYPCDRAMLFSVCQASFQPSMASTHVYWAWQLGVVGWLLTTVFLYDLIQHPFFWKILGGYGGVTGQLSTTYTFPVSMTCPLADARGAHKSFDQLFFWKGLVSMKRATQTAIVR